LVFVVLFVWLFGFVWFVVGWWVVFFLLFGFGCLVRFLMVGLVRWLVGW
jgi:hypothetical protein